MLAHGFGAARFAALFDEQPFYQGTATDIKALLEDGAYTGKECLFFLSDHGKVLKELVSPHTVVSLFYKHRDGVLEPMFHNVRIGQLEFYLVNGKRDVEQRGWLCTFGGGLKIGQDAGFRVMAQHPTRYMYENEYIMSYKFRSVVRRNGDDPDIKGYILDIANQIHSYGKNLPFEVCWHTGAKPAGGAVPVTYEAFVEAVKAADPIQADQFHVEFKDLPMKIGGWIYSDGYEEPAQLKFTIDAELVNAGFEVREPDKNATNMPLTLQWVKQIEYAFGGNQMNPPTMYRKVDQIIHRTKSRINDDLIKGTADFSLLTIRTHHLDVNDGVYPFPHQDTIMCLIAGDRETEVDAVCTGAGVLRYEKLIKK